MVGQRCLRRSTTDYCRVQNTLDKTTDIAIRPDYLIDDNRPTRLLSADVRLIDPPVDAPLRLGC